MEFIVQHVIFGSLADIIDRQQGPLERYQTILHLLHKAALGKGEQPWQDAAILIQLRNEITHYKSQWAQEMERKNLFKSLQELRLEKPPFMALLPLPRVSLSNTGSAFEVARRTSRSSLWRPMQPRPDPRRRLVLPHLEHAAGRLRPAPHAPPSDKGSGERSWPSPQNENQPSPTRGTGRDNSSVRRRSGEGIRGPRVPIAARGALR